MHARSFGTDVPSRGYWRIATGSASLLASLFLLSNLLPDSLQLAKIFEQSCDEVASERTETKMKTPTIETRRRLPAVVLLLLVHVFAAGAVAQQTQGNQLGVAIVSDAKTGTILLNARLNGDPIVMILDTGSGHSLFDARAFGMSPAQLQSARLNARDSASTQMLCGAQQIFSSPSSNGKISPWKSPISASYPRFTDGPSTVFWDKTFSDASRASRSTTKAIV